MISGLLALAAPSSIQSAIAQASARTGADFDYLMRTAARESGFDNQAKAKTSSASGLFQFIEQTWLGVVQRHGAEFGLGEAAGAITQDAQGRYQVSNSADKAEILALRHDPKVASLMAGALTEESRSALEASLGRPVNNAELYMAHFLGTGGAVKLIQAAETSPGRSAAQLFPDAAAANRSIFYGENGRARSVSEVYANLSAKHSGEAVAPRMVAEASTQAMRPASGASFSRFGSDLAGRIVEYRGSNASAAYQQLRLSPAILDVLSALNDPVAFGGKEPGARGQGRYFA